MAPDTHGSSFHLRNWGIDLQWQATPAPPGAWSVAASVTLPAAHPVLPGEVFEYAVTTSQELVSGGAPATDLEAALRRSFALPCHQRGKGGRGCQDMADQAKPGKVAKAFRTLLRCGLNGLIFELDLNESLDLHVLFGPGERDRTSLLEHLSTRPGLLPLVGKMLENDVGVRESFGRQLRHDIAATADQGRLGQDRVRSFVQFCQTRLRYLVHDTRRFFLARKTGATFFLTHHVEARAQQMLLDQGAPADDLRSLDRALGLAQKIGRRASLETCEAFHASMKKPVDFTRRRWVCRHCIPGQVVLGRKEEATARQLASGLRDKGPFSTAELEQVQRTCLRHTHYRTCMTGGDGEPLIGFVRDYLDARGLTPEQVSGALATVCVKRREEDGAPCELSEGFSPDEDVLRAVSRFVVEVLSRLRLHGDDDQVRRILSCIFTEVRNTGCTRLTRCKVYIFRDIQYSRLGRRFLDQVRRCFLLPEDLMWYFWYGWAGDPDRPLRTGTRFVGDCKQQLEERVRRGLLAREHSDTLKAQLFSYFPDEMGLVPLWHLREALPGCEQVLGQRLPGMDRPWNEQSRARCWELLMDQKDGPRIPTKGVTSFEELMLYQPHEVSLEALAEKGVQLAGEEADRENEDEEKMDEEKKDEDEGQ